jgi:hypothetical protein
MEITVSEKTDRYENICENLELIVDILENNNKITDDHFNTIECLRLIIGNEISYIKSINDNLYHKTKDILQHLGENNRNYENNSNTDTYYPKAKEELKNVIKICKENF